MLSVAVRRWAALSANGSPSRTRKALAELVAKRYVVVDDTTEELILRTYVKHAGGLKIPNVVIGLTRDYAKIASAELRRVVLEQVDERSLARIKARSRIPDRFVREWEAFNRKAFPVVRDEPKGEPPREPLPEGFEEGFQEPLEEHPRIQPTTDNRRPTTDDLRPTKRTSSPPTHIGCASSRTEAGAATTTQAAAAIDTLARRELDAARRDADTGRAPRIGNPTGWLAAKRTALEAEHGTALRRIAATRPDATADELLAEHDRTQRINRERAGAETWGATRATGGVDLVDTAAAARRMWPTMPELVDVALAAYDQAARA